MNDDVNKNKQWSTRKKTAFTFLVILIPLLLLAVYIMMYTSSLANKIDKVNYTNEDIYVSDKVEDELSQYATNDELHEIINIALFGIDADSNNVGRSDSIMILTIDPINNKLKLSSIMRDSYVDIPGYGKDKINHAFAFGDSVLALKTLNYNFELNVNNFMAVNFTNMPKIIDKLGGITLNITDEEISNIPGLTKSGSQLLNGQQVLAYTRIRYASGDDFQRTLRHRTVLNAIFDKLKSTQIYELPELLEEFLPLIQTNLSTNELLSIGNSVIKIGASNLIQDRFPRDGYWHDETINGVYYLGYDIPTAKEQMREFIYSNN